jgi:hypothetical protein
MKAIDLEYEPGSLLPPARAGRIRAFERWLSRFWERPVRPPAAYFEHITAFHGGVPGKKCFRTPSGRVRVLGRFFNFLEEEELEPPVVPTWRPWGGRRGIRQDYRVAEYLDNEPWARRIDQLNLLPFAGLDTAGHYCRGMDEYDLLCLDHDAGDEPAVVTWDFHLSGEGRAVTEVVAASFAAFLPLLYRCRNRVTAEAIETF